MQKKIIALAVAGLMSGAAFAQSNVQIYGVADAFFGQNKATAAANGTNKATVVNSGNFAGSRIGFRGTEDLGNGMKALFTLEYAISLDTAVGPTAARQSFVGLTGGFGTFVAGKLHSPGYNLANKFGSGIGGGSLTTLAGMQDDIGATINQGGSGRLNNAMAYVSPKFNGFTATVAYTTATETATASQSDRVFGLGLDYDNGPLAVSFAHHNIATPNVATDAGTAVTQVVTGNMIGTGCTGALISGVSQSTGGGISLCGTAAANSGQTKQKENAIAASYNFGVAKVMASYQTVKDQNLTTSTTRDDARLWNLGANIPVMGNGEIRLGYTRKNDKLAANEDATGYSIGYVHTMSKRTSLYGGYAHIKNKNTGNAALAGGGLTPAANNGKSTSYGIGLRHSF